MPERQRPPGECAQCGAAIPPRARACPECGADERTGWRESSVYDGLDLPDAAYQGDGENDPCSRSAAPRVNGIAWYWWLVGVAVLLATAIVLVGGR